MRIELILMSRAPVPGATKTRLIPLLGAQGARDFHAACLQDLVQECAGWLGARRREGHAARLWACITPPGSEAEFTRVGVLWPADTQVVAQRGVSLEERIQAALDTVFAAAGRDSAGRAFASQGAVRALVIGSDVPLLQGAQLDAAVAELERCDAVFGPALDGGYYLAGLRRPAPGLFAAAGSAGPGAAGQDPARQESAQPGALELVLHQARSLGLGTACIDVLPDADTPQDLATILAHPLAHAQDGALRGRRSVRWLRAALAPPRRGD